VRRIDPRGTIGEDPCTWTDRGAPAALGADENPESSGPVHESIEESGGVRTPIWIHFGEEFLKSVHGKSRGGVAA